MKVLLVTLALLTPANGGSLGIGIDVLPEAFTFAARRVGFSADLRLTTCTASRCLWTVGDGVKIAADRSEESLYVYRLEATLDLPSPETAPSASRYESACLAIVALVDHDASLADLRVAAKAISSPTGEEPRPIRVDTSERRISLYGAPAPERNDKRPIARRCGATAA